jgi:hypothetical protein
MGKISVLLTEAEDARFGAYCDQKGYKKSTLIARLIRDYLDKEGYGIQDRLFTEAPQPPPAFGVSAAKKVKQKRLLTR